MSAPTAKSADSQTIDGTGGNIFDSSQNGGVCAAIEITNPTANTQDFLINIPGLHVASEFFHLSPGRSKEFFLRNLNAPLGGQAIGGISTVFVKSASGSQTCTWGVTGK